MPQIKLIYIQKKIARKKFYIIIIIIIGQSLKNVFDPIQRNQEINFLLYTKSTWIIDKAKNQSFLKYLFELKVWCNIYFSLF